MNVTILIPTALRSFVGGQSSVLVHAVTAGAALDELVSAHPALAQHLRTPEGKLRSFVNVYKGDEDIRHLQKEATPLVAGDILTIVPSIAGGAR